MATYPNTTAASDVWSLRDVYKAEAGDDWPEVSVAPVDPVTITSLGTTVTQSSRNVTNINLLSVSQGDQIVLVYGSEGAGTVSSATLAGTSVSVDLAEASPTLYPSNGSTAIMSVVADSNIAGASSATLAITSSGTETQYRSAVAVFILSRSATVFASNGSNDDGTSLSTQINFSQGALFTSYYAHTGNPADLTGVANSIDETMGGDSAFTIGYSDSTNSGSATHSIGYTNGEIEGTAFGAVVYS